LRSSSTAPLPSSTTMPAPRCCALHRLASGRLPGRRITAPAPLSLAFCWIFVPPPRPEPSGQASRSRLAAAPGPASLRAAATTAAGPRRSGAGREGTPWGMDRLGTVHLPLPDAHVRLLTGAWLSGHSSSHLSCRPSSRSLLPAFSRAGGLRLFVGLAEGVFAQGPGAGHRVCARRRPGLLRMAAGRSRTRRRRVRVKRVGVRCGARIRGCRSRPSSAASTAPGSRVGVGGAYRQARVREAAVDSGMRTRWLAVVAASELSSQPGEPGGARTGGLAPEPRIALGWEWVLGATRGRRCSSTPARRWYARARRADGAARAVEIGACRPRGEWCSGRRCRWRKGGRERHLPAQGARPSPAPMHPEGAVACFGGDQGHREGSS